MPRPGEEGALPVRRRMERWLTRRWYGKRPAWPLLPLVPVFIFLSGVRRWLYRGGLLGRTRVPVPVIVVGNITVGGTGKTPMVRWLCRYLEDRGLRPGIVSRGYGGRAAGTPVIVDPERSTSAGVGDEALMLSRMTGCPVAVCRRRGAAAETLWREGVDIIVSDDGLQHYALERDIEIVMIDARAGLGNGWRLPAGPLREPRARLGRADFVVGVGGRPADGTPVDAVVHARPGDARNMANGERRPLESFGRVHAVAGIARPERFFEALGERGVDCERHAFSDHHDYRPEELEFADGRPVLMTEKDAVKCRAFGAPDAWSVPLDWEMENGTDRLMAMLERLGT